MPREADFKVESFVKLAYIWCSKVIHTLDPSG